MQISEIGCKILTVAINPSLFRLLKRKTKMNGISSFCIRNSGATIVFNTLNNYELITLINASFLHFLVRTRDKKIIGFYLSTSFPRRTLFLFVFFIITIISRTGNVVIKSLELFQRIPFSTGARALRFEASVHSHPEVPISAFGGKAIFKIHSNYFDRIKLAN